MVSILLERVIRQHHGVFRKSWKALDSHGQLTEGYYGRKRGFTSVYPANSRDQMLMTNQVIALLAVMHAVDANFVRMELSVRLMFLCAISNRNSSNDTW